MKEVSVFYSKPRGVFISAALLGMLILPSCNLPTDAVVMEESMDAGFESSNEVFDRCDFNGDGTVDSKESRICEQQQGIDNAEKIDVQEPELIPAGGTLITYVNSAGVGNIAVRLELPEKPRYPEGAIVVYEFLRMPLSMPKRAFFFGFSLLRILILIGVVGITALIGLTFDLCLS